MNRRFRPDRVTGSGDVQRIGYGLNHWIGGLVLLTLVVLLSSCTQKPPESPSVGVTLNEITARPDEHLGKTVTVSGEVNRFIGPRALTIGGDDFFDGQELLIVRPQEPSTATGGSPENPLREDDIVQVTGQVTRFDLSILEKGASQDLSDTLFKEFVGQPAIIAQTLIHSPRKKRTEASPAKESPDSPVDPITDERTIFDEPDKSRLIGRNTAFTGAQVLSVEGDRAFWIGPSEDKRMFVVLGESTKVTSSNGGEVTLQAGQTMTLSGVLKRLPNDREALERWNIDPGRVDLLKGEEIYLEAKAVQVAQ